ncbi:MULTISPECIES: hypothetical protein [unclassified Acinetobacter]|uniref:hypothetical protein n=1 Tax=unclassified Acinetobacter TaxID=196816 RepID=UPI0004D8BFA7|nr:MULTISPECIES: hypothetical protein [unclassified Acinetobacter]KEC82344.1 hypothetical protein DT74_04125 [Acinetobacter sp. ETR1]WEE38323.1 hypothetical protein PYV58_15410 [Acinetobacter sp. TAC-1]
MMQAFLAKFYETVIIAMAVFLLLAITALGIQSWRVNHFKNEYTLLNAKYKTEVAEAKALAEQAKASAALKEKQWSEQQLKAEQNYNAKIKQIKSDADLAQSNANSLSKQLKVASSRLSSASKETIIKYTVANSDILENCITEYRTVAEKADGHAADAERLREAWPSK